MVSLSDDSRRSGGFFFDHNESVQDTDELLGGSYLGVQEEVQFRKIDTTYVIILMSLVLISFEIEVCLLPHLIPCLVEKGLSGRSILLYSHGCLWFIILLFDRYLNHQHYVSRSNGYLEFHRKTRLLRKIPLGVQSAGNAFLLIIVTLLDDSCSTSPKTSSTSHCCRTLGWCNYIQIIVSLEVVITLAVLLVYLVWTIQFNHERSLPDINQEELLMKLSQSPLHTTDIGCRDDRYINDVLEKQADMIRYLRQHNASLSRRILGLSSRHHSNQVT